jgi:hypothetical protein
MLPIAQSQNTQQLAQAASTQLLRNFSELVAAGSPYAGLPIASGQWWGRTGAEIAASAGTGEHGAGLLANDSLDPAAEYRLVVRNSTFPADTLVVDEDGAVEYLAAGSAVYDLYEANILVPGGPAAISGGFVPTYTLALAGMQVARAMPAVGASYTPPVILERPTITQSPRSATVQVGRYAAFQVFALGATGYQWRRNGASIPGAVRAAYTTDPVQTADNGAVFDVQVSNGAGTSASASAVLTVVAAAPIRIRGSASRVLRIKAEGPSNTYRID